MNELAKRKIKAIVFDAYGTLFDVSSIDEYLSAQFGAQAAALIATHWRRKQLEYTWLRSMMQQYVDFYSLTEDALRYALKASQSAASKEAIRDLMSQYYQLKVYPEVPKALKALSGSYQLAILSNANPSLLEKAAAYNAIDHLLDKIISVDELACYKPAPKVYALAVQKLQLPAEQILFLSSNTWDIAGATAFGLMTCWINRQSGQLEELGFQPALSLSSLEELLAQLV